MQLTDDEIKLKHPLEYSTHTHLGAYMQDYLDSRPLNSLVIQNPPHDLDVDSDLRRYLEHMGPLETRFGDRGIDVKYDLNGVPALVEVAFQSEGGASKAKK